MGIVYTPLFKRGVFLGASMLYRLSNRQIKKTKKLRGYIVDKTESALPTLNTKAA